MGTVRKKKCRNCGEKFRPRFSTLEVACSIKCAVVLGKAKEEKKKKAAWKEEKQQLKEKLKTLTNLEDDAKKSFQKWVRERDKNKPCVSCGTRTSDIWDGGHFYKAEIYSGLIFDERNCHKQCRKCNRFLGGNENNYRLRLIEKFGEAFVLQLDADAIKLKQYRFERSELKNLKRMYDKKYRELKNG